MTTRSISQIPFFLTLKNQVFLQNMLKMAIIGNIELSIDNRKRPQNC
jgi:predicted KAP-like P-loop ATPase